MTYQPTWFNGRHIYSQSGDLFDIHSGASTLRVRSRELCLTLFLVSPLMGGLVLVLLFRFVSVSVPLFPGRHYYFMQHAIRVARGNVLAEIIYLPPPHQFSIQVRINTHVVYLCFVRYSCIAYFGTFNSCPFSVYISLRRLF